MKPKQYNETIEIADVHQLDVISLLYQTGYLTIKKINRLAPTVKSYTLGYPNEEVRVSLQRHLLGAYLEIK